MSDTTTKAVWQTELSGVAPPKRGKVRDIYDLGDELLIVACDRLSAFDHVLPTPIPDKGKILNQLTNFWFEKLSDVLPNHLLAVEVEDFPAELAPHREVLRGRSVLARKADVIPFECVARGYLAGSAYRHYSRSGTAFGQSLAPGLLRASRLDRALFTPTTKAETGHDEDVDFPTLERELGAELATRLREVTLELYGRGEAYAGELGLILADTKFEFGRLGEELLLIDEVLTPDSSRYWEAKAWQPGEEPVSFDKQFVRNWLDEVGWDHSPPPPELPPDVVEGTRERYLEAYRRLTGKDPEL